VMADVNIDVESAEIDTEVVKTYISTYTVIPFLCYAL